MYVRCTPGDNNTSLQSISRKQKREPTNKLTFKGHHQPQQQQQEHHYPQGDILQSFPAVFFLCLYHPKLINNTTESSGRRLPSPLRIALFAAQVNALSPFHCCVPYSSFSFLLVCVSEYPQQSLLLKPLLSDNLHLQSLLLASTSCDVMNNLSSVVHNKRVKVSGREKERERERVRF